MVGKDTIERMAKTLVDSLHKQGARDYGWSSDYMKDAHRDYYRKAITEVVKSVGAKVEGEPE